VTTQFSFRKAVKTTVEVHRDRQDHRDLRVRMGKMVKTDRTVLRVSRVRRDQQDLRVRWVRKVSRVVMVRMVKFRLSGSIPRTPTSTMCTIVSGDTRSTWQHLWHSISTCHGMVVTASRLRVQTFQAGSNFSGTTGLGIGYAWMDEDGVALKAGVGMSGDEHVYKLGVSWEFGKRNKIDVSTGHGIF
jgi:hypothetical protein